MSSRYICEVTGKNFSRFLKHLEHVSIWIYSIEYHSDKIIIELDEDGYKKLCKMKTTYQVKVLSYKGKARCFHLLKKYRLFLGSIFLGLMMIFVLSHLIWKIEVIHTKAEIRSLLLDALEEEGVHPFIWKLSYEKKEKVKNAILEAYKDQLEWLEIEEIGTKYLIRVEERKIKLEKEDTTPRNIIASKDAMILSIQAESGEVVTKKFDYVKKGDPLISGIIHKEEEAKKKVRAEGEVYGEVWYTVSVLLPVDQQEEKVVGKPKKKLVLHFLNHVIDFEDGYYKTKKTVPILKSFLLPISLEFSTMEEVKMTTKHYDLITGEKEGIRLAREKLLVKLDENSSILSQKVLKKERKGSKIYIEVFFKVKENIVTYQSLENIDLTQENQTKEEG